MLNRRVLLLSLTALWIAPQARAEESTFIQAAKWARANDGIAISISLGSDAGLDPNDLIKNIENGFGVRFRVKAEVIIESLDTAGSSVMYFIDDTVTEPEPFQTGATLKRMEEIVSQYRAYIAAIR